MDSTENNWFQKWNLSVKALKKETLALFLAYKDPRTPWYAKAFAGLVVAYAFSPLDLIPDFIPVLGYLDDLILIPAGIALALKMIPAEVMRDSRIAAQEQQTGKPVNWIAAGLIVLLWISLAWLAVIWMRNVLQVIS
jgi:uncharacterized membrane protein YkvA (DUF1232 family)